MQQQMMGGGGRRQAPVVVLNTMQKRALHFSPLETRAKHTTGEHGREAQIGNIAAAKVGWWSVTCEKPTHHHAIEHIPQRGMDTTAIAASNNHFAPNSFVCSHNAQLSSRPLFVSHFTRLPW
jgi:hypothetical protein